MSCPCSAQIFGKPSQPKLRDCLCINDVRVGCDDGPTPCGDTITIDLTEYNNVTASECDVVYSLIKYDPIFESVDLTSEGVLTVTTSENFVDRKQFTIDYKVDSPCSILSGTACVYICIKNPCGGNDCEGDCNLCTGDCIPLDPEVSVRNITNEIGIS